MFVDTPDELVAMLERLTSEGSPSYQAATTTRTVTLDMIAAKLDAEGRDLLARYEDESTRDATHWAVDHFRFGFAIGQSGVLDQMEALGLVEGRDEDECT